MNNFYGYQPNYQRQFPQYVPQQQPIYQQPVSQIIQQPSTCIQGKSVDSIEVVKAMDIPLDGSISYFPLTDGTAIVSKQLQQDGTSKTIIYKPTEENSVESPKYVTTEELNSAVKKIDNNSLKDELKALKRQIKSLSEDIEDLKDREK